MDDDVPSYKSLFLWGNFPASQASHVGCLITGISHGQMKEFWGSNHNRSDLGVFL
jgi:hypothetical protein